MLESIKTCQYIVKSYQEAVKADKKVLMLRQRDLLVPLDADSFLSYTANKSSNEHLIKSASEDLREPTTFRHWQALYLTCKVTNFIPLCFVPESQEER